MMKNRKIFANLFAFNRFHVFFLFCYKKFRFQRQFNKNEKMIRKLIHFSTITTMHKIISQNIRHENQIYCVDRSTRFSHNCVE